MSNNEVGKTYERPWGKYKTLAIDFKYQLKTISIKPGGRLSLQKHLKRSEHWIIIQGQPTITIAATIEIKHPGEHVFIPLNAAHRIENFTNETVIIIEVQIGEYFGEDDIIRLEDIYGRT
jgi:mannose-6-phosphate isomerase